MNRFEQFLSKNTVKGSGALPLVHTSPAFHLRKFAEQNVILTSECDVFKGEDLSYFFVGRPAYKYSSDVSESSYWEFPCCFVFEFDVLPDPKRVFPFDSGAFDKKLYPSYIKMMEIKEFEVSSVSDAPSKIIGTFFGNTSDYFKMIPKSKKDFIQEYSLSVMDMEIQALHRLSLEAGSKTFDDRRLTIEVQSNSSVDLVKSNPIAVIAPSEYFEDNEFLNHVLNVWKSEPISYPIFSLNINSCFSQIYERVFNFYKMRKYL